MSAECPTIGILALQGDCEAHREMLEERLGVKTTFVRNPQELAEVDGVVLPGGESTTIAKLMARNGLDTALKEKAQEGTPIFGTCAGLILLARRVNGFPDQPTLGLMDIDVERNAFGRQIESFETDVPFGSGREQGTVRGVFIRAPAVTRLGRKALALAHFGDKVVAVRQANLLGASFHPELTHDASVHRYFLSMIGDTFREKENPR